MALTAVYLKPGGVLLEAEVGDVWPVIIGLRRVKI